MKEIEVDKLGSLGYLSGKVHGLMKARLSHYLKEANIPLKVIYYPIISRLWKEDGVSQQTIADWMNFDRHRTSRVLDELEATGLIVRQPNVESKREKLVWLTEYGRTIQEPVLEAIDKSTNKAFHGITAASKTECIQLLRQIITNLNK